MIQVPLSVAETPARFAAALESHRAALEAHRAGAPGVAAPTHPFGSLIRCVPRGDPLPDAFEILPYEIVDDTPRSVEEQRALDVLRETLGA